MSSLIRTGGGYAFSYEEIYAYLSRQNQSVQDVAASPSSDDPMDIDSDPAQAQDTNTGMALEDIDYAAKLTVLLGEADSLFRSVMSSGEYPLGYFSEQNTLINTHYLDLVVPGLSQDAAVKLQVPDVGLSITKTLRKSGLHRHGHNVLSSDSTSRVVTSTNGANHIFTRDRIAHLFNKDHTLRYPGKTLTHIGMIPGLARNLTFRPAQLRNLAKATGLNEYNLENLFDPNNRQNMLLDTSKKLRADTGTKLEFLTKLNATFEKLLTEDLTRPLPDLINELHTSLSTAADDSSETAESMRDDVLGPVPRETAGSVMESTGVALSGSTVSFPGTPPVSSASFVAKVPSDTGSPTVTNTPSVASILSQTSPPPPPGTTVATGIPTVAKDTAVATASTSTRNAGIADVLSGHDSAAQATTEPFIQEQTISVGQDAPSTTSLGDVRFAGADVNDQQRTDRESIVVDEALWWEEELREEVDDEDFNLLYSEASGINAQWNRFPIEIGTDQNAVAARAEHNLAVLRVAWELFNTNDEVAAAALAKKLGVERGVTPQPRVVAAGKLRRPALA